MNVIETTKLTKYFGTSRGIVDLDMTVLVGEIFAPAFGVYGLSILSTSQF